MCIIADMFFASDHRCTDLSTINILLRVVQLHVKRLNVLYANIQLIQHTWMRQGDFDG